MEGRKNTMQTQMLTFLIILGWVFCGGITAAIGYAKSRKMIDFILIGLLFGPFSIPYAVLARSHTPPESASSP
jgi:hypothetical protein